jgi:PPOX class probable F420-dependent enzyme
VTAEGAPRPIPIWFLWDGDSSILLYSRPDKQKLRNIAANPNVSLNLDSDRVDADIVICWGQIRVSDDPPSNEVPDYLEKYRERIAALGWTPESFAGDFSVPLRIELSRIHGW